MLQQKQSIQQGDRPQSAGIGGPVAALFSALSGIHAFIPFSVLSPLWSFVIAPVTLICPPLWPIALLFVLQRVLRKSTGYIPEGREESNLRGSAPVPDAASVHGAAHDELTADKERVNSYAAVPSPEEVLSRRVILDDPDSPIEDSGGGEVCVDSSGRTFIGFGAGDALEEKNLQSLKVSRAEKARLRHAKERRLLSFAFAGKRKEHEVRSAEYDSAAAVCGSDLPVGVQAFIRFDLKCRLSRVRYVIAGSVFVYWILAVLLLCGANIVTDLILEKYRGAALQHQVLRIITDEQLNYTEAVVNVIAVCIMLLLSLLVCCFVASLVAMTGVERPKRAFFEILLKNLPGFVMLGALLYGCAMLIERYYAHVMISDYRALMAGKEVMNSAWIFILLRVYLLYAFLTAFILCIFMSLGLLPRIGDAATFAENTAARRLTDEMAARHAADVAEEKERLRREIGGD